jgi:copper chaperone CopZ
MCSTTNSESDRPQLGLHDLNAACGCSSHASASPQQVGDAVEPSGGRVDFLVEGMTCSHCEKSITEEVSGVRGVENVKVALNPGGASTVSVVGASFEHSDIHAAIAEAGYTVTEQRA